MLPHLGVDAIQCFRNDSMPPKGGSHTALCADWMLSKFKIARKECAETESWLKLMAASGIIDEETFKSFRNLCGRIQRMLTASCITIEKKINI